MVIELFMHLICIFILLTVIYLICIADTKIFLTTDLWCRNICIIFFVVIYIYFAYFLIFQAPFNEFTYEIIGDGKGKRFFAINPQTGRITLKSSIREDPDLGYVVGLIHLCTLPGYNNNHIYHYANLVCYKMRICCIKFLK